MILIESPADRASRRVKNLMKMTAVLMGGVGLFFLFFVLQTAWSFGLSVQIFEREVMMFNMYRHLAYAMACFIVMFQTMFLDKIGEFNKKLFLCIACFLLVVILVWIPGFLEEKAIDNCLLTQGVWDQHRFSCEFKR